MRTGSSEVLGRVPLRRMAAILAGVVAVLASTATAATAHTANAGHAGAAPTGVVRPAGIGYANSVRTPTVMRTAPTDADQAVGTAHPGDNIADICWIPEADGIWDLVLERTGVGGDHFNNTTAFIKEADLSDGGRNQHASCSSLNDAGHVNGTAYGYTVPMWSASWSSADKVGHAYEATDDLVDVCSMQSGDGNWWDLLIDVTGHAGGHLPNTTGFVPEYDLAEYQIHQCGQS